MGKPVNVGEMVAPAVSAAETVRTVDAVADMLTPGEWVELTLVDNAVANSPCQMRLNAGRVELRGSFSRPTDTGNRRLFQIADPAYRPEYGVSQPMAAWEYGVRGRPGYVTVNEGGEGRFEPGDGSKWNRGSFTGVWWPAPGFRGPMNNPARQVGQ